jgi:membrane-associated phospholipid phosphatase
MERRRSPRTLLQLVIISAATAVVTVLVVSGATADADHVAADWFMRFDQPGAAHVLARTVVMGGQFWLVGSVLAIAAMTRSWLDRSWRPALVCGVSMVVLELALWGAKAASGRTSPHSGANDVLAGGTSYPSGHAAIATLCLLLLAAVLAPRGAGATRRTARTVWLTAGLGCLLVSLSTLVLGYHWPTDVIGGWLVALLVLLPALRLLHVSPTTPQTDAPPAISP